VTITWLAPWYPAEGPGQALEDELARECGPQHRLHGVKARLIARRDDTDDALFALPDGRVAEVHLTWRQSGPEPDPRWPAAGLHASLEDWARDSMNPLAEELRANAANQ